MTVLDRVDPGAQRVLDSVGADRVRGDPHPVGARLADRGAHLLR